MKRVGMKRLGRLVVRIAGVAGDRVKELFRKIFER